MSCIEAFDLFPAHIGLTRKGKTSFKTKLGGVYTILICFLTLAYAIIIIVEPLKASNSSTTITSAGLSTGEYDDISSNSAGSKLPETKTVNEVEFEGTYQVHKYTQYINNASYNNAKTFTPHQEGFQVAFELPQDYNSSYYSFIMYSVTVTNLIYEYEVVEYDFCNTTDFPEEVREELEQNEIGSMI